MIFEQNWPIPLLITGHKAPNCPLKFTIRTMTLEEIQMELMVRLDVVKLEALPMRTEEEAALEEDFVQDDCYEWPPYSFSSLFFSLFLSFLYLLIHPHQTPSISFPIFLCCPQTISMPSLYLMLSIFRYESYLFLDLQTSDGSFYQSSLYLAYDSYRLMTHL